MEARAMNYDVIVSAVHDRGDLLDRTLRSMLQQLDQKPARVIVHEDARNGQPFHAGRTEEMLDAIERDHGVPVALISKRPGAGLGRAMLRLLEAASTEFVFFTQEDFDFLRPVPVGACLELMTAHHLHHVRFNKRKTMRIKGEHHADHRKWWTKQEVQLGGQTLCISDHWYFQASIWRREIAQDGFRRLSASISASEPIDRCEAKFNHLLNATMGGGVGSIDGDQDRRRDLMRTFIWGGVGELAFIQHTGHDRRSQGWDVRPRCPNS
jgi:hypothetical protein